jgi:hypothetical protein
MLILIDNLPASGQGLFGFNEATWVSISAIVAALAAGATFYLALLTRELARRTSEMAEETKDLVKAAGDERLQVERHHQQTLMPIVYLEAECCMQPRLGGIYIVFQGEVRNVGGGPSTGINILLKPSGYVERIAYQGLIGPNERRPFKIEWRLTGPVPVQDVLPYDSITRFRSIFETEGAIHQKSSSGLAKNAIVQDYISPTDPDSPKRLAQMITNIGSSQTPMPI